MEKSPEAFRTISEVADFLDTPAHVLRFWESRFPQIRPVKRAGGRRYYRPADVALLAGIKRLLHDDGLTIRGVQKILREQGVRYVAGLSPAGPEQMEEDVEAVLAAEFGPEPQASEPELSVVQTAQIISLERALAQPEPAASNAEAPLWPEDEAASPNVPGVQWPQDPLDISEAPFTEVDADDSDNGIVEFPSAANGTVDQGPDRTGTAAVDPQSPEAEEEPAVAQGEAPTVAAQLRRLPPHVAITRKDELRLFHQRLFTLRERLAQAARRRVR